MKLLTAITVAICICSSTNAQLFGWGKCPEPDTKESFDITKYIGVWHEIMRYNFVIFEAGTKCTTATYELRADGESVNVYNRGVYTQSWRGDESDAEGMATVPDPSEPAKLRVTFESNPFDSEDGDSNYWVVDTDYDTYSIVYSCSQYWFFHTDIIWILARTPEISDELKEDLVDYVEDQGLRADKLRDQDQSCYLEGESSSGQD